jgi:hypothetical protein
VIHYDIRSILHIRGIRRIKAKKKISWKRPRKGKKKRRKVERRKEKRKEKGKN